VMQAIWGMAVILDCNFAILQFFLRLNLLNEIIESTSRSFGVEKSLLILLISIYYNNESIIFVNGILNFFP
jgi:hypothetical protein